MRLGSSAAAGMIESVGLELHDPSFVTRALHSRMLHMQRLFRLNLIVAFAALAGDLSGNLVPDRKPLDDKDSPKTFTNSIGMKFIWIPPGSFVICTF